MNNKKIITIDGLAGSGKSTVAKRLADSLGWTHVNTGSIYRTFGFLLLKKFKKNLNNLPTVSELSEDIILEIATKMLNGYKQDDHHQKIYLDKTNISDDLHTPQISKIASTYAQNRIVRKELLPLQRKIIESYDGVVVDGRDMGTVVFPNATLKIFLTANENTRTKRRFDELKLKGINISFDTLLKEIKERDFRDSTRDIAPTKPAEDAIIIDSSYDSIDEVVQKILKLYRLQE